MVHALKCTAMTDTADSNESVHRMTGTTCHHHMTMTSYGHGQRQGQPVIIIYDHAFMVMDNARDNLSSYMTMPSWSWTTPQPPCHIDNRRHMQQHVMGDMDTLKRTYLKSFDRTKD